MSDALFEDVKAVLVSTLGIEARAAGMTESSPLFGAVPELDSLGVLEVVTSLERRFGIAIDDEEFSGEIFETFGALTRFVESKRRAADGA